MSCGERVYVLLWMYERADFLTIHNLLEVALLVHIEDVDRQVVVLAHADGGQVHDAQAAVDDMKAAVGEMVDAIE